MQQQQLVLHQENFDAMKHLTDVFKVTVITYILIVLNFVAVDDNGDEAPLGSV